MRCSVCRVVLVSQHGLKCPKCGRVVPVTKVKIETKAWNPHGRRKL